MRTFRIDFKLLKTLRSKFAIALFNSNCQIARERCYLYPSTAHSRILRKFLELYVHGISSLAEYFLQFYCLTSIYFTSKYESVIFHKRLCFTLDTIGGFVIIKIFYIDFGEWVDPMNENYRNLLCFSGTF